MAVGGYSTLSLVPELLAPLLFLLFMSVSARLSSVLSGAIIVEVYGRARLGRIRNFFSVVLLLSVALAPLVFVPYPTRKYALSH